MTELEIFAKTLFVSVTISSFEQAVKNKENTTKKTMLICFIFTLHKKVDELKEMKSLTIIHNIRNKIMCFCALLWQNCTVSGSLKEYYEKNIIAYRPTFICPCPHCGCAFGVTFAAGGEWHGFVDSGKSVVICFACNMVFIY